MDMIKNMISGMIIGVANIIPGVSGGTMAVVLGIYDKLIDSVSNLFHNFKKNLLFLIPVALGAGAGIILFSALIKYLLGNFPIETNFFFLGLILGGIPMIYKRAVSHSFRLTYLIPFFAAVALMLLFTFYFADINTEMVVRTLSVGVCVWLVLTSAIAAACMILPGISGSMILMILGAYTTILTAISELNLLILIPAAGGIAIGLLGGARIIDICLKRVPGATYFVILGLIVTSIVPVFRNAGFVFGEDSLFSFLALPAGIAFSVALTQLQKILERHTKNPSIS